MSGTEFIVSLLKKFEDRLEHSLGSGSGLSGVVDVLESTVAEAQGLGSEFLEGDGQGRTATSRDFATAGALKTPQPWEKIHV
jgi:hypothetical protein